MPDKKTSGSKFTVYAALTGNVAIACIKFIAAAITGSSAMLTEGVHSIVDCGNEALLLYGMRRARRPPDEQFPFGHGKEIYFWSFVVALVLFAAGASVAVIQGVQHLLHGRPLEHPIANYIVLGLSAVFDAGSWLIAFRHFGGSIGRHGWLRAVARAKDPVDFAVLLEDSASLAGIAVAFVGIALGQLTGSPVYDGIASIVIGAILAATAYLLARETKGLLIGESANREVVAGIRRLVEAHRDVVRLHDVLTMHMGPHFILVNIALEIPDGVPAERAAAIVNELDAAIKREFPRVRRIFVEIQPSTRAAARPLGAVARSA